MWESNGEEIGRSLSESDPAAARVSLLASIQPIRRRDLLLPPYPRFVNTRRGV